MHTDSVGIEFDPAKAAASLKKHGVSFGHAEQALRDLSAITIEDPDATGEQRFITLGMDALGRVLVIVHSQRDERTRLISARKASPGEVRQYHA
ncbi:MAG: BrnT family toxin [Nitrococcus sp.]|nr:BrnT family toxin [Nitrococcus sp.]